MVHREKPDRLIYACIFVLLLAAEILIGLFAHDSFVRPYFGDALVVILLWAFVRVFVPRKILWLSALIFVFAVLVELSQSIPLVDFLGIENRLIRILMGTSFAPGDILAYAAGCAMTAGVDWFLFRRRKTV